DVQLRGVHGAGAEPREFRRACTGNLGGGHPGEVAPARVVAVDAVVHAAHPRRPLVQAARAVTRGQDHHGGPVDDRRDVVTPQRRGDVRRTPDFGFTGWRGFSATGIACGVAPGATDYRFEIGLRDLPGLQHRLSLKAG